MALRIVVLAYVIYLLHDYDYNFVGLICCKIAELVKAKKFIHFKSKRRAINSYALLFFLSL